MSDDRPGYTDTAILPHSEYCVHDADRPRPPAVDPGEAPEEPVDPPSDAAVLFGGDSLDRWESTEGGEPTWTVEDGVATVTPGTGGIKTTEGLGDCQLHLEWATPEREEDGEPGQGQGNSGVFLMDRYEIQVLDSYENPTYADGYAGAVYGQYPPDVNPAREPGEWQAYDIVWTAPRFEDGELASPAEVTVIYNGVVVQNAVELIGPTTHAEILDYEPHPPAAPLKLQNHGDPVRFRNIWYRDR
jgi:hypothetical protein